MPPGSAFYGCHVDQPPLDLSPGCSPRTVHECRGDRVIGYRKADLSSVPPTTESCNSCGQLLVGSPASSPCVLPRGTLRTRDGTEGEDAWCDPACRGPGSSKATAPPTSSHRSRTPERLKRCSRQRTVFRLQSSSPANVGTRSPD
ncbi:hypothetical protein SNL152K_10279 [Streptomyces sp. NL15-2K]|nr:hypothetical protein SNL152K_10279 [Streptomyces sp. NL15-2K]